MGERGRSRLERLFTVPRMVRLWTGIYTEVAGPSRRASREAGRA
jgi:hypothetical protein